MNSVKVCDIFKKYLLGRHVLVNISHRQFGCTLLCRSEISRSLCGVAQERELKYECKEVAIPVPGGTLAGKLWEPSTKEKVQPSQDLHEVPPVICLHGWLDNAGSFDLMLPLMMTQSTKYFCLDFPGHGLTTYCPDWWYDSHIEGIISVKRTMKHLGWDKFSILGHSLGGIVGFLYSAYFPEDVHRLVTLENMRPLPVLTNRIDMLRTSVDILFEVEKRMRKPRRTYSFDDLVEKLSEGRQGTISKEGCVALLKRGACKLGKDHFQFSYNLRTNIPGQEGRTPPELSIKLVDEISSPICFIKGNPGNIYDSPEEREYFLGVLKRQLGENFEYHEVPGSHHFHLNDPHLVAGIALKFLTGNVKNKVESHSP